MRLFEPNDPFEPNDQLFWRFPSLKHGLLLWTFCIFHGLRLPDLSLTVCFFTWLFSSLKLGVFEVGLVLSRFDLQRLYDKVSTQWAHLSPMFPFEPLWAQWGFVSLMNSLEPREPDFIYKRFILSILKRNIPNKPNDHFWAQWAVLNSLNLFESNVLFLIQ